MAAGFERSGTVLTVHLPTELDHPVSDEIRRESDRIIGHEYIKNMIFDFSETVFMDSSGIAVALHTMQQMKQLGGKMRIGYPSAQVKKVFTAAGLQQLIELEEGHEK